MQAKIKQYARKILQYAGLEIRRFTPIVSDSARLKKLLAYHAIDLVLDIGANIGQFATHLREIGYAGKIVSFKPLSSAPCRPQDLAKKDPLWTIVPRVAIGDKDGLVELHIAKNSFSSSILPMLEIYLQVVPESRYIDLETAPFHKLDTVAPHYINDSSSVFLKVDVQGLES